jgi:5'-nucleotidase
MTMRRRIENSRRLSMTKKIGLITLALMALLSMGLTATMPAPMAQEVKITIAHTNDTHARIVESKDVLGFPKIATEMSLLRSKNPNTLLIDAGDTFHGLPIATIDQGASIVKLMNMLGYDYMTTGNHDYNYGFDRLLQLQKMANFEILAANVYKDGKRVFVPYDIRKIGGVRVAFVGLATPETAYKTDPKGIEGVTFSDPIVEGKQVVTELAGKYDVLVLISHIGIDKSSNPTSIQVAEAIPEIDVILDGHSHSTLADIQKENTTPCLITSTGAYGSGLGIVELVVNNGKLVSKTARTITPANSPSLKGDVVIADQIKNMVKDQDVILSQVVAKTAVYLEGKRDLVRTQQTNLGTLIANAMLYVTGADVAIMNGGGIRDSIPAGDITKKQVLTVQPFSNYIQTAKIKGSEFKAILENGVGKLPAPDGRFPHVANLTYTLDVSKPAGDRVSDIMIGGQPVDPNKDYVLATLNYLFNGGDDYRMLAGRAQNDFPLDAEVFIAYAQHLGMITDENMVYKK